MRYHMIACSIAAALAVTITGCALDTTGTPPPADDATPPACTSSSARATATDTCEGPVGPQGPIGPQGPAGTAGDRGPIGPTGQQGERGLTGPQGAPGTNGTNGTNGAQGPQGNPGTPGAAGAVGQRGPTGATGPAGPTMVAYAAGDVPGVNFSIGTPMSLPIGDRSDSIVDDRFVPALFAHSSFPGGGNAGYASFPDGYIVTLQPTGKLYFSGGNCSGTMYQSADDLSAGYSNVLYRTFRNYPMLFQLGSTSPASFAVGSRQDSAGSPCFNIAPGPGASVYGFQMIQTSFGLNTNSNLAFNGIMTAARPWTLELE